MPSGGGVRIELHRVMPGRLAGGSVVAIEWTRGEDHLVLRRQTPFVALQLGSARVRGVGVPGQPVRVKATRGATVGKLSGTASPVTGRYAGKLLNRSADLPVAIGDIITSTSSSDPDNATFTIAKLSLEVGTESVSGLCFPGDPAWLTVSPPSGASTVQLVKPDDTGAWNSTAKTDPGTRFRVDCTTDAGDVVSLRAVAG